mgnify:CR=1 FL=1
MTHMTMTSRGALLLSLLLVQGMAFAAPPSKHDDDIRISTDQGRVSLDWDDKEYDWWQNNCLNISTRSSSIKLNCDNMDGKYRDHYNRSIHSGNNPGKGLTGILCCNADIFLQALEGPRDQVNALYNRLADDSRHKDLCILDYAEIDVRHYSNWSMGWAGAKQANRELFLKYSSSDRFDPFNMSAVQVAGLLQALSETLSAIKSPVLS